MKKTILALALCSLSVMGVVTKSSAQVKEGSITYLTSAQNLPPEYAAMGEGEMKVTFKNGKTRIDNNSAMGTMILITDGKGNALTLMEGPMGKMYIKSDLKKDTMKEPPAPKITYVDEKKTVAGYECKKALVEMKTASGAVETKTFWYTEKIAPPDGKYSGKMAVPGLKGVPLEFEMKQMGYTVKYTATAVSTSAVPDAKFEQSTEGYTEMDPNMMKGMGGQ